MTLGRGCGSTAWCAGNWAMHGLLLAMFDPKAQREVFKADRFPIISTGFSPARAKTRPVEGGAAIEGRWDFASGVHHADWIVLVALGPEGPLAHLVPTHEVQILDTWHTGGLRGSGSTDVTTAEIFVPIHRILNLAGPTEARTVGRELYDSPWFRLPMLSIFTVASWGQCSGWRMGRSKFS